jgi:hypothetical protein
MDEGKKSLSWMIFSHGSSPLPVDDKKILANLFWGFLWMIENLPCQGFSLHPFLWMMEKSPCQDARNPAPSIE